MCKEKTTSVPEASPLITKLTNAVVLRREKLK